MPPGYNYRAEVRKLIPQLRVLDEVPATHTAVPAPRELRQDWLMVKEAIKEGSVSEGLFPGLGMAATPLPSGKGCPTPPGDLTGWSPRRRPTPAAPRKRALHPPAPP